MCKEVVEWTKARMDIDKYTYASRAERRRMLRAFVTNTPQGKGYYAAIPKITDYLEKDMNLNRFDRDLDKFRGRTERTTDLSRLETLRGQIDSYRVPEDLTRSKETVLRDLDRKIETARPIMPRTERTVVLEGERYERKFYPIKPLPSGEWRENVTEWYRISPSGRRYFVRGTTKVRLEEMVEGT